MLKSFIFVLANDSENEVKQILEALGLTGLENLQAIALTNLAEAGEAYVKESAAAKIQRKAKKKKKKRKPKVMDFDDVPPGTRLCTLDEACAIIGISRTTLKSERDNGRLTDVKKGKRELRFLYDEVETLRGWYAWHKGKG